MPVVDNFHVKIRYIYTHIFLYVFKSCNGFIQSNCVNEKNMYMFSYIIRTIKLLKCKKKNTFAMRNTQYNIELSVHKQPSVFNTTYAIQCRVNCPIVTRPNIV